MRFCLQLSAIRCQATTNAKQTPRTNRKIKLLELATAEAQPAKTKAQTADCNLSVAGSFVSDRWPVAGVGMTKSQPQGLTWMRNEGTRRAAAFIPIRLTLPQGVPAKGRGNDSHRARPLIKEAGCCRVRALIRSGRTWYGGCGRGHLGRARSRQWLSTNPRTGAGNVAMG